MLCILKSMSKCTYFSYAVLTSIFGKLCIESLKYMSILTVFYKISTSPIEIQYIKTSKYNQLLANIIYINGEKVFMNHINSFLSNISCVILLFNVIIACLLCISICFLITFEYLSVNYMLKPHLYENKFYFYPILCNKIVIIIYLIGVTNNLRSFSNIFITLLGNYVCTYENIKITDWINTYKNEIKGLFLAIKHSTNTIYYVKIFTTQV